MSKDINPYTGPSELDFYAAVGVDKEDVETMANIIGVPVVDEEDELDFDTETISGSSQATIDEIINTFKK